MAAAKVISLEEVSKHNTAQDTWFAIDGKVYDVSKFLDEHPGGGEILVENSGGDATLAFNDVGHSKDAREMLKDYYIGDLEKTEAPKGCGCVFAFIKSSWILPATAVLGVAVLLAFYIARK